jgi:hypothetical protein
MVAATGMSQRDRSNKMPGVRIGTTDDLAFAADIDRAIRRGAHGPDLPHLLDHGSSFLIVDDRGYALAGDSGPQIVAALDRNAAEDLLRTCLSSYADGTQVLIPRIGARNQWALGVALDAGLFLSSAGALMIKSNEAATSRYLPDNVFC